MDLVRKECIREPFLKECKKDLTFKFRVEESLQMTLTG